MMRYLVLPLFLASCLGDGGGNPPCGAPGPSSPTGGSGCKPPPKEALDPLVSLSQEEYDALEGPTEEEIQEALDAGYRDAFGRDR
jgi:hypothetical protein